MASCDKPENPADLGSRGGSVQGEALWWKGSKWLADRENWPSGIVTIGTPESQAEAKVTREAFAGVRDITHAFDVLVREHMFKNELPWEICEESKPLC